MNCIKYKKKLTRLVNIHRKSRRKCQMSLSLTVGFEAGRLAVAASCLVDSLDKEDITGATLQAVHRVVVLLDVGNNHPALQRVTQTCEERERRRDKEKEARVRV